MRCILAKCSAQEKRRKMINNYKELRERLAFYADDEYRDFVMRGIPSERPFIGVRIPQIREIAGLIPKEKIEEFLAIEPVAFEEVIVRGLLVCRLPYDEMIKKFDSQIKYIGDWCACDIFCSALRRNIKKHRAEFLDEKVEGLLDDSREFATRVGTVLLKCYYVDFDYLNLIFDRVEKMAGREEYYVRMAIAWLVAECFIKFPEETLTYMKISHLPKWTYNKTISKVCDSYRVDEELKDLLKKMRK